ncbi:MAG: glycoside hydrolase family 31 protein, partial [Sphingobacteriales bacterium]
MKKTLLLLSLIARLCFADAQDVVMPVGDIKKVAAGNDRLDLTATNGYVRIQLYSPTVVRIRISDRPFQDDFSYAVVAQPAGTAIKPLQTSNEIRFSTDSLQVIITKNPFSVRFLTLNEQLINEDEPGLGTSWIGTEVTTYKHLQDGERFIGLGEKTGNLDRKGSAYTNWNSDVYGYAVAADPLYSTIPFYIGIHHGLQYGIFFDNSYQSDFNFGASNNRFSSFSARGGEMNYYLIYRPTVAGIISDYTWLTGRMPMPPLWSLGYQQNRYSYYPDTEVLRIAQTLREKKIPADGITLDIHYMDAYKLFTWNKTRFPDPAGMIGSLAKMGFKTTLIVDPGIKVERNYAAYESGVKESVNYYY